MNDETFGYLTVQNIAMPLTSDDYDDIETAVTHKGDLIM